ncbi:MAG TPA: hypothetical protein VFF47_01050, partial [Nitrospirota bacterium]|nr:hypothetical protein [Nitrospirota bacterium]
ASIRLCLDGTCYSMTVDASAAVVLRDGNYANGEQYVYSNTLTDGTHNYYFNASDGLESASLPLSGNLSGPIVTNTYTPVGLNVVVKPDVNVTITFDQVTATGDTYVTNSQTGSTLPSGYLHGSPPAYFDIWTTATYTGKVRMCFTYADQRYFGVGYGGERGLRWLHVEGGAYRDRTVVLDVNNNFVCGDVYSFSEFSAAVEEATLVTLTSFRAIGMADKVLLTWSTAAEVDSMGFNILRGPTMAGPFTRINSWLIRSKGSPTMGRTYNFEDTGVENGVTYFYKLENVDINGSISTHMIASATPFEKIPEPAVHPSSEETSDVLQDVSAPLVIIETESQPVLNVEDLFTGEGVISEEVGKDVTDYKKDDRGAGVAEPQHALQESAYLSKKKALTEPVQEEYPTPGDFAMKIEDDKGNELGVRQVKDGDKVNEPFEVTIDDDGKAVLKWVSVGNIKRFNVQRWESKDKKPEKVNTIPIPYFSSQAGEKGLFYTFRDAGVRDNAVYKYKIEVTSIDGSVAESEPVEISTEKKNKLEPGKSLLPATNVSPQVQ